MRIFAHRGLNRRAPENTLAAFQLAHEARIEWLETDVDIIADNTPIILHDSTLDRTTNATGSIYSLQRGDLKKISAGAKFADPAYANEPIPQLSDLVDFLQKTSMRCNLEIKSNEAGGDMSRRLLDAVLAGIEPLSAAQLLISSFNHVLLYMLHERRPELPLACLFTRECLWEDAVSRCELVGARTIHPQNEGLTAEVVRRLKDAGLSINVWTVNDPERAAELDSWQVDGIFTDIADEIAGKEGLWTQNHS